MIDVADAYAVLCVMITVMMIGGQMFSGFMRLVMDGWRGIRVRNKNTLWILLAAVNTQIR